MTFEEFVAKAREVRGDRFEYRTEGWAGIKGKVLIVCPNHGEFRAAAHMHLRGIECPKCSRPGAGMTFDEMVVKAVQKHGERYSYVDEQWVGMAGNVVYDCPDHGRIVQKAFDHLNKGGCRQCGRKKGALARISSLDNFIEKARRTHGERYQYLHPMPETADEPIIVTCPDHGEFRIVRSQHINGGLCPGCKVHKRRDQSEFVADAIAVHGDSFTYEKAEFAGMTTKVVVTCPVHGDFSITPASLILRGSGCSRCVGLNKKTTDEFIEMARERYGDRYDYSKVEYTGALKPVIIICRDHGEFLQKPNHHFQNTIGCPKCTYSVSKPETDWLDSLGVDQSLRQARIRLSGRSRSVDAYDPVTNTVYEFWGSWWHGDPAIFSQDDMNKVAKRTFGELYRRTIAKRQAILDEGFNLVEIWESEFREVRCRLPSRTVNDQWALPLSL